MQKNTLIAQVRNDFKNDGLLTDYLSNVDFTEFLTRITDASVKLLASKIHARNYLIFLQTFISSRRDLN